MNILALIVAGYVGKMLKSTWNCQRYDIFCTEISSESGLVPVVAGRDKERH